MFRCQQSSPLFPYTTLFRSSGELMGLIRTRSFCLADAHIICASEEKAMQEVSGALDRSEEHTSELQSLRHLVCRLLLEKKKTISRESPADRDRTRLQRANGE